MKTNSLVIYMVFLLGFSCCLLNSSCNKLIAIDPPRTEITTDKVFVGDNSAIAAISNIYTWFSGTDIEGNLMPNISLYDDEVYPTTTDATSLEYYNNDISVGDANDENIWRYSYFIIYESNSILLNLRNSLQVSSATKRGIIGEAEFLRAFAYFFLVNLYGRVPLITTTDVINTSVMPKADTAAIYKQIIKDLKNAENSLSEGYPTSGRTRANKYCAAALLSRVYLYQEDWPDAEKKSSEVINSGEYGLDSLNKVFLMSSKGTIIQFWQKEGYTNIGKSYIPGSAGNMPRYVIDSSLLSAFEPGDLRKEEWLDSVRVSGRVYYYPYKYKLRSFATGDHAEYTILLRLGEQYLIRAESRAQQNDLAGAVSDLNMIRSRAGLPDLPTGLSRSAVLSAVAHERRVELFTEWGHRFFDLKRTGQLDAVLGAVKPSWHSAAKLYPIPQNELNNNPHLTQNAGY